MDMLGTAKLHQSQEYQDVTLRIETTRGSTPVLIVSEGIVQTPENIGTQLLEAFSYFVRSSVYESAKERNHARCQELGVCICRTR